MRPVQFSFPSFLPSSSSSGITGPLVLPGLPDKRDPIRSPAMDDTSFLPVRREPNSSRTFPSPLSRFMAAFLVLLSAFRYNSTSFFSFAVRTRDLEEEAEVFLFPAVLPAEEALAPVAASRRDFCVTPRTPAIFLRISCAGSFSPRSILLTSEEVMPDTFSARAACVSPFAVRASFIRFPSFLDTIFSVPERSSRRAGLSAALRCKQPGEKMQKTDTYILPFNAEKLKAADTCSLHLPDAEFLSNVRRSKPFFL